MIRFQICIFDILNTALWNKARIYLRCDSLSNLYLWHIKYSGVVHWYADFRVVIRFQICIFDILNTANLSATQGTKGCDSLSNLYLWHIKYSLWWLTTTSRSVVIRFQICIFDILNTALLFYLRKRYELWFAFKFVSLTY